MQCPADIGGVLSDSESHVRPVSGPRFLGYPLCGLFFINEHVFLVRELAVTSGFLSLDNLDRSLLDSLRPGGRVYEFERWLENGRCACASGE